MGLLKSDATGGISRLGAGSGLCIAAVRVKQRVVFSGTDSAAGARARSSEVGRGTQTVQANILFPYQIGPLTNVELLELWAVVQVVTLTTLLARLLRLAGTGTS